MMSVVQVFCDRFVRLLLLEPPLHLPETPSGPAPLLCVQQVTGWFYLLAEEYGRSKHLRVTSQRSRPIKRPREEMGQKEAESGGEFMLNLVCSYFSATFRFSLGY